jgi:hypothetical protein
VHRVSGRPDYDEIPTFDVGNFLTEARGPETFGQFFLREGTGFELVMWCFEESPRAIWHNPNDPVHTDSCMEGFVNYYPEMRELGYLSVEINANAAVHSSFGSTRHTRKYVLDRRLPHPEAESERLEIDGRPAWRVRTLLRLELLKSLYGRCDFEAGHLMRANFYKCGDHTAAPHWRTWAEVGRIDFHTPEFFGELVIV